MTFLDELVSKYRRPDWWKTTAREHAAADKRCGREWVCACAACRLARDNNWQPREDSGDKR